jgi:hypothetical protein
VRDMPDVTGQKNGGWLDPRTGRATGSVIL